MTQNKNIQDLLYYKGKIKKNIFYLKPKEFVNYDYNLNILISINI